MSYNLRVKGNITTNVGGSTRIYAKGNVEINSNGSINYYAPEYTYGDPEDPPKRVHPDIVSVQFLDENNLVLKQETIAEFGSLQATNILYGKKIKIKIVTKEVADGTKIEFAVKGNSKNESQKFLKIDALKWNLEIQNNTCETDLFSLNILWYNEDYEYYDYNVHKTKIKAEDLNTFTIEGILCFQRFELLNDEDELKPIAYLRNYEELIGLFNTNNSGEKTLIENYENKFINYNPEIFKIASEFSDYLSDTEDLKLNDIKARVKTDAKKLWDVAVKQVQTGNLDDRPLYWARNKMQVSLKRNPLFEKDINFETSTVNKDSQLEKIIQLFEEQSRNYTNIDFSKAAGKKKVLITGFDPFQLNPDPEFNSSLGIDSANIYNPSGIVALFLNNNQESLVKNICIQTCIFPVRYEDFDNECVEKVIKKHIEEVDMIMTTSLNGVNDWFDIEQNAIEYRGGLHDNICIGGQDYKAMKYNEKRFISNTNTDRINTTLPQEKIFGSSNLFSKYIANLVVKYDISTPKNEGSGSNYLSNEVMFRATKIRGLSNKPVGHLHLANLKTLSRIQEVNNVVVEIIKNILK